VEAVCRDDKAAVWVADQDGRPAGFVALRIMRYYARLDTDADHT
jgi:hypothetical protein